MSVCPATLGFAAIDPKTDPGSPIQEYLDHLPSPVRDRLNIDIETCEHCGGAVKVIASIEDPAVIKQILEHLDRRAQATPPAFRPFARAPPTALPGLKEPG